MAGETEQWLTHFVAACHTCDARCDARNAQAWAHNHAKRNPGHAVAFELGYAVRHRRYDAERSLSQETAARD